MIRDFRRYMVRSAGLAAVAGALFIGSQTFANSVPTFSGYRWPSSAHLTYHASLHANLQIATALTVSSATMTWDPVVTMTTGQPTSYGLPISIRFNSAPLFVADQNPGLPAHETHTLPVGTPSLKGFLRKNGRLTVTDFTLPTITRWVFVYNMNPLIKSLITRNILSLMPPVPRKGWAAGDAFLAPDNLNAPMTLVLNTSPLPLARLTILPAALGQWVEPKVGQHHWQVSVVMQTPHPIAASLEVSAGENRAVRKTSVSTQFSSYSYYVLDGQRGGLLDHEEMKGQLRIKRPELIASRPQTAPTTYTLKFNLSLTLQ